MKNTTIKNLIVLASLVILANANLALAYVRGVWEPQPRIQASESSWTTPISLTTANNQQSYPQNQNQQVYSQNQVQYAYNPAQTTVSNQPGVTTVNNYYYQIPTTKSSSTTVAKSTTNTAKKTTSTVGTTKVDNTAKTASNLPPVVTNQNNLPALSVQGNGGFMPSSVFQWILVVILIFAVIVIVRVISRPKEIHDTHMVGAH